MAIIGEIIVAVAGYQDGSDIKYLTMQ